MTIADHFFMYMTGLRARPGSDDYGMAGLKWMFDHDPYGNAALSADRTQTLFTMSDGSRVLLNMQTGVYQSPTSH